MVPAVLHHQIGWHAETNFRITVDDEPKCATLRGRALFCPNAVTDSVSQAERHEHSHDRPDSASMDGATPQNADERQDRIMAETIAGVTISEPGIMASAYFYLTNHHNFTARIAPPRGVALEQISPNNGMYFPLAPAALTHRP